MSVDESFRANPTASKSYYRKVVFREMARHTFLTKEVRFVIHIQSKILSGKKSEQQDNFYLQGLLIF